MVLVDPKMLEHIKQQQTVPIQDPLAKKIKSIDATLKETLNATDENIHTQALEYQQALRRFIKLADEYRDRPLGKVLEIKQKSDVIERKEDKEEEEEEEKKERKLKKKKKKKRKFVAIKAHFWMIESLFHLFRPLTDVKRRVF